MDLGILKGKVYDGEKGERIPIPNVILKINEAQGFSPANEVTDVTNRNGEFIFPSLKQGTYYLQVLENSIGLANILVELKNAKEALQQVTGEQGGFSFQHIRPGKWTMKIYEDNFPAYHYLEKKEFHIELNPGEENRITANVLPTHRPIQMIDEGVIINKLING